MSRVDELIDEMKAEENRPATPAEEVKETPAAEETVETKDGGGAQEPATADAEVNDTKSPEERGTTDKGNADEDVLSRAEFSFKRKLEKMNQKHAAEIAERDRKYEEMKKEFEELKKTVAPKDPVKGRKDFETDDEYIDYLTQRRVEALMAERDGKDAERREKEAEEARKQKEAEAEIAEQQQKWLNHVDRAFGDDKARAQKFLSKIQYANRNGLGEILDACPVAADFLMNQPNGCWTTAPRSAGCSAKAHLLSTSTTSSATWSVSYPHRRLRLEPHLLRRRTGRRCRTSESPESRPGQVRSRTSSATRMPCFPSSGVKRKTFSP